MTAPRLDPFDALDALDRTPPRKPRGVAALDALDAIDRQTAKAVFGPVGQGIGRPGTEPASPTLQAGVQSSLARGGEPRTGLSEIGHGLSMGVARPLASLPEFAATVVPEAGARLAGIAQGLVKGGHALPPGMARLPGAAAEAAKPSVLAVAQAASQPTVDVLHRPFAPLRALTDRVLGVPENTADKALEAVGNLVIPGVVLGGLSRLAARRPVAEPSTAVPVGADLPQFVEPSAPQAPAAVATDVPRETTVTTPAESAAYTGAERRTSPREGQPGLLGNERGALGEPPKKGLQAIAKKAGLDVRAEGYGGRTKLASDPGVTVEMLTDKHLVDMTKRAEAVLADATVRPEAYRGSEELLGKIAQDKALMTTEQEARLRRGQLSLGPRPSIDHGLLSPSGRVSKVARKAALERTRRELFGEEGLAHPTESVPQQTEKEVLLRQAAELRSLAERGMKPRAYLKKAQELETRAATLPEGGTGALKYLTGLTGAGLGGTAGAASIKEDDSPAVRAAKIAAGIAGGAALGYGGARMAENLGTKGAVPALVERPTLAAESNPLPPETSPEPIRPERYVSERQTEAEIVAQRAKLQQDVGPRPTGKPVEAYPSGPEDYQVQVNKIRDDPLFTKGVQEKVARLKAEGVIQPKRVVGRKLVEEQARAASLNEVMGVPRGDGLRDYHGLALRNRYADLDQLRAQADAKLAATPPTDPTYATAGQDLQDIELQQRAVLARFVRGASQSGRDLKSLQYLASQSLDPLVWDRKAIQAMGQGSVLTSDVHARLRELIGAGDKKELARYVASLAKPVPMGSLEWLVTLRKAGLLSGVRTTIRNTVGAVGRGTLDLAGKPAATGADAILSLLTGQRTTTPGDLQSWRMGAQGLRQGFAEMGDALKGNLTEAQLEKLDFGHLPRPLEGRFAQAYARTLFGWQAAIDRPNSVATYMKSLSEQAKLLAKGSETVRAELTASPTADMIARAQIEAAYAAYQNETVLGNAASAFKRAARKGAVGIPGEVAGPLADLAVPFVKTPAAVAGAALETTPLGAIGTGIDLVRLFKAVKVGLPEPEIYALQRSAARRVGRWSTGLLATYVGYELAAKGRMTGALPVTTSERDAWRREGKQAYSVRLGGRWAPLAQLGPLAMAMGIGASWQQGDGAAAAAGSVGQQITQLPFLQGVQQIGEALGNAKSASRFAESTAGSFVPTMGSDIARAADPNLRDPENIGQGVLARIPGASRLANPALDVFGQPIPRETSTGARVASTFLDFTGSRPDRGTDDPLVADLNRLGVSLTDRRPGKGRDEATTRALIAKEGPMLRAVLEQVHQAGIPDSGRKEAYERVIRRVRGHFGRLPSEAAQ